LIGILDRVLTLEYGMVFNLYFTTCNLYPEHLITPLYVRFHTTMNMWHIHDTVFIKSEPVENIYYVIHLRIVFHVLVSVQVILTAWRCVSNMKKLKPC